MPSSTELSAPCMTLLGYEREEEVKVRPSTFPGLGGAAPAGDSFKIGEGTGFTAGGVTTLGPFGESPSRA